MVIVNSPANVSLSKRFQFGERQRQPICLYRLKSIVSHSVKILTKNNSMDQFFKINLSFCPEQNFLKMKIFQYANLIKNNQDFYVIFKELSSLLKQ